MQNKSDEYLFISSIIAEEFIDIEMTEKISSHISKHDKNSLKVDDFNNGQMQSFENLCNKYASFRNCKDVISACSLYNASYGLEILKKLNLDASNNLLYLVATYGYWSKKKVGIVVLSNTILLLLIKEKRIDFLCALLPSAFKLEFNGIQSQHKQVIVDEKSKEPIEYYDKFNPYTDSKILSRHWEKTNLDGSRSFAGGLKPENNPLHFELEYGLVKFYICGLKFEAAVSNSATAKEFVSSWENISTSNNNQFLDMSKQTKIRNKCIGKYFNSSRESNVKFWRAIKTNPLYLLLLIVGLVVGAVVVWGIIEIMFAWFL